MIATQTRRVVGSSGAVKQPRPKVEPIRNPTLFEMAELEQTAKLTSELKIDRPFSLLVE